MTMQEEIRRRRRAMGMTQTDLAHSVGVGLATVSRWEQGLHDPKLHQLKALAKVFGVSELDLMYPKGEAEGDVRQLSLAI